MTTFSAVVTTGIYCRPGCGARPLAENTRVFELPAAAEAAGFRACHRCRPYRVAGPVAAGAPELVCQATQLIIDGALDNGGTEAGLADRAGVSARHLRRLFQAHLGATPDELARSRRAHFARRLLDDTDLAVIDVAFASGFGSLRQFNRTMQEVFRAAPTDLRRRRRRADRLAADGGLALRLPVLPGYDWAAMRAFLAARCVPGVEAVDGDTYRRTIAVGGAPGLLEISPGGPGHLALRAHLPYWEGLIHVVGRVGQLLGLDADHAPGAAALAADPALGAIVRERPGLAVPGAWSPLELGVWAILRRAHGPGRVARLLAALAAGLGTPVPGLPGGLTHVFPAAETITPAGLAAIGFPAAEATAAASLAAALARAGRAVGPGASATALAALRGVEPDVRDYLAFRLGQRDAFPAGDAALAAALADLGLTAPGTALGTAPGTAAGTAPSTAAGAAPALAPGPERWRSWPALAAAHLMAHGDRLAGRPDEC
jgi:AraC family transcriptional regulator of adaptative response / DNA-3-methyladenine glycosylase II